MNWISENRLTLLWTGLVASLLGLLGVSIYLPTVSWALYVFVFLVVFIIGNILFENRKILTGRSGAHGLVSLVTALLVICIVGVINYISYKHPMKIDLTENQVHTLSDQTSKVMNTLPEGLQVTYFSKVADREKVRTLFDNFKSMSPRFDVEYVDPFKDPAQAKAAGIKSVPVLHLQLGEKTSTVDAVDEEKLTNALIKLTKNDKQIFCVVKGHGEKDFEANTPEGYSVIKKGLEDQAYSLKVITLGENAGTIPEECRALGLVGPAQALFDQEVKILENYLAQGGRLLLALDPDFKGNAPFGSLKKILDPWHVSLGDDLVFDLKSRIFAGRANLPILEQFNKDSTITKGFKAQVLMPNTRSVVVKPGAPTSLKVAWLGKTSEGSSWADTKFRDSVKGGKLNVPPNAADRKGVSVAVSVEGKLKDSKAKQDTRLVVFGTSNVAINNYARFDGNMDLFLNSASWLMEDESLISIRSKDKRVGKITLSNEDGQLISWLTVVIIPVFMGGTGVVVWRRRRRL